MLHVLGAILTLFIVIELIARLLIAFGCRAPIPYACRFFLSTCFRERTLGSKWTLDRVGLQPGSTVLELGTGPGALTPEASRRVGDSGFVAGMDIQAPMLRDAQARIDREGLRNVALLQADAQALPFRDGSFDAVFLVAVLGEIPSIRTAMAEINRVLAPGGMVSITELLPDPHYCSAFAVSRHMRRAGFTPEKRQGSLFAYTLRGFKTS